MIHFRTLALCSFVLLLGPAFSAEDVGVGEGQEVYQEEHEGSFSARDYEAMRARFSDEIVEPSRPPRIADLLAPADLVVEGVVSDISYSYSGEYNEPSTHVVIAISHVLKGTYEGNEITITQPGGPSIDGTEATIASHTEFFDVGEEELLFLDVKSGDQFEIKNRFRVYRDQVYNVDGYGVLINDEGALRFSNTRNTAERFSSINMGTHRLRKVFSEPSGEAEGDRTGSGVTEPPENVEPSGRILTINELIATARQ